MDVNNSIVLSSEWFLYNSVQIIGGPTQDQAMLTHC